MFRCAGEKKKDRKDCILKGQRSNIEGTGGTCNRRWEASRHDIKKDFAEDYMLLKKRGPGGREKALRGKKKQNEKKKGKVGNQRPSPGQVLPRTRFQLLLRCRTAERGGGTSLT